MKTTIYTIAFLLSSFLVTAQDKIYIHTANESNITSHVTYIDHPELNGNPDAPIVFCQNANTDVSNVFILNNNPTGLWYSGPKWAIVNENFAPMLEGTSFNIYIADDSEVYNHLADASNSVGNTTQLTIPGVGSTSYLFYSNYFNLTGNWNENPMGNWFFGGSRALYTENNNAIEGTAYKVMHGTGPSSIRFSHTSSVANTIDNLTVLDHPMLNENPNATFIYSHYWGGGGPTTEVFLPHHTGVAYLVGFDRWVVFTQDEVDFPENVYLDIIIADQEFLSTQDFNNIEITIYPNPVINELHLNSNNIINSINIYTSSGRQVISIELNKYQDSIDLSALSTGLYLMQVKTEGASATYKIIKK